MPEWQAAAAAAAAAAVVVVAASALILDSRASGWEAGSKLLLIALGAMTGAAAPVGGLLRRRLRVYSLALGIFLDYKLTQKREKWCRTQQRRDALWEAAHDRNARRVYAAVVALEGLWVKAGQYLSTRADVLPEAYILSLQLLQDALPARPFEEVKETVERELGCGLADMFLDFDRVALGTASIAQVHRATLKDGIDVVVKVQHVGVKQRILQDLRNLRTIVQWVAWAEPKYNFSLVLDEWCLEVPKELDFVTEAENTRQVADNLLRSRVQSCTEVDVLLPEVFKSTEKVLIMSHMDGARLNDAAALDKLGVDKQALVEEITKAYAHQIYVDGFFNADPHPGNFLVSNDPPHRPVLLDFGLTKKLSPHMKMALAKMLLSAAEGDFAALLSAFEEMGLKLKTDMPDEAMAITSFFFRRAAPPQESLEENKAYFKNREERRRKLEEDAKGDNSDTSLRRNPVDAFPSEAVFFIRVLSLLRGLSSTLGARVSYLEVMRPFAEATLLSGSPQPDGLAPKESIPWIFDSPTAGDLDAKVRELLLELGRQKKMLGMQVCVYKDGEVVVDVAAGVLGKYDPRPVQPNSLFSVFSATKGVTAGLAHWLADQRRLSFDARVAEYWPTFGCNGKETCTVAHVLTHRAGLHDALSGEVMAEPTIAADWEGMLSRISEAMPTCSPGAEEIYHALTFGWLAGGVVEAAAKRPFQQVLEEALTRPLGVDGEFYIGIPPGVETRLATLALDPAIATSSEAVAIARAASQTTQGSATGTMDAGNSGRQAGGGDGAAAAAPDRTPGGITQSVASTFNALYMRRSIVPAANGHFSARALARYYAMLAAGGVVPDVPATPAGTPPLGKSAPALEAVAPSLRAERRWTLWRRGEVAKGRSAARVDADFIDVEAKRQPLLGSAAARTVAADASTTAVVAAKAWPDDGDGSSGAEDVPKLRIFQSDDVVDACVGAGAYAALCLPDGHFGLGFQRFHATEGTAAAGPPASGAAFGHIGLGGSVAFCNPAHGLAVAVTLNLLSETREPTAAVVHLVCSELDVPVPAMFMPKVETSVAAADGTT
eukprot:SM000094S24696  [mRNA]  locus=s94:204833:212175:- [translate_table: standard]